MLMPVFKNIINI